MILQKNPIRLRADFYIFVRVKFRRVKLRIVWKNIESRSHSVVMKRKFPFVKFTRTAFATDNN